MGDTLSNETHDGDRDATPVVAVLTRVIAAHAPLTPPSRHVLRPDQPVHLGRGERAGWRRDATGLTLLLDDGWASERHARLRAVAGVWEVEDLGAKNGVLINGVRTTRALLADGDLLEIGRTYLRFTAAAEWTPDEPLDAAPVEPLPGVRTVAPGLARSLGQLATVARGLTPIVLLGPTGAGKELAARGVHAGSLRGGDFVAVNCAAIPRDLVESTLFGHRRGAFSGATDDQPGLVRSADRGTLFLDEVAELSPGAQAALLRVLQEREVVPVGASRPVPVDLRVVVATHRDLPAMVRAGGFRADLWHRLRGFTLTLPALAARRDDLGLIVAQLAARHTAARGLEFQPRAVRALLTYGWPGNVRELEQVLVAALALAGAAPIGLAHLPTDLAAAPSGAPAVATTDTDAQRAELEALLEEHGGSVRAIARVVGKDPVQVRRWLRRFGLDAARYRRT